jgi:hypothetical protein
LAFCKTLRSRWPEQRLYLILDNFSPHKYPNVTTWCATNNIELVFLPTNASWPELDRTRIHRRAPLRPQRHRPPKPPRARHRDRRVYPNVA